MLATPVFANAFYEISAVLAPAAVVGALGAWLRQALSDHGYTGRVAATAESSRDAEQLSAGASDLILFPFRDAARQAVYDISTHS